jgi:predicted porin
MKLTAQKCAALALLLAGSATHAQENSSVTIYGVADAYVGPIKTSNVAGSPQGTAEAVSSGGMTTPFIGFRGVEDLGGGYKALFKLESFYRIDTGQVGRNDADPLWGRASFVGLDSPYGRVTFGRQVTPYSLAATFTTPLKGTTAISPIFFHTYKGNILGGTRMDNAIGYFSPTWNGANFEVLGSLGNEVIGGPTDHNGRALEGVGRYANGPFSAVAGIHYINTNTANDGHKQKAYMAGGIYDFGFVKLNAQMHYAKDESRVAADNINRRTYEVGAAVPFGGGEFDFSYAYSNMNHIPSAVTTPDNRRSYVLAYDYSLSKRTDVYAAFFNDKLKNSRTEGVTQIIAVGVRHLF